MVNENETPNADLDVEQQLEMLTQKVKQNGEIIEEIALETINIAGITEQ